MSQTRIPAAHKSWDDIDPNVWAEVQKDWMANEPRAAIYGTELVVWMPNHTPKGLGGAEASANLTGTAIDSRIFGMIVAIGEDCWTEKTIFPRGVRHKIGDIVAFPLYGGECQFCLGEEEMNEDGTSTPPRVYKIIRDRDVKFVLRDMKTSINPPESV